jgi:DNA-binding LytR/AlgR family response regulator
MNYTALIAEDEPLLAVALQAELVHAWSQLQVCAVAANGLQAVQLALQHLPQVLFFDIQMPGQSGLDAVAELADEWPADRPFPAVVFVTAFDQYAVQAFEAQALDYVLKPVQSARLAQTVARVQARLQAAAPTDFATLNRLLQNLAPAPAATPLLSVLQAGQGSTIEFVPVADVIYFEAADKYVRVLTASKEHLIRMSLRDLLPQLNPAEFWQVHRSLVVRASAIASATRDEQGKLSIHLRQRARKLPVSRLYSHLFRAM